MTSLISINKLIRYYILNLNLKCDLMVFSFLYSEVQLKDLDIIIVPCLKVSKAYTTFKVLFLIHLIQGKFI